MSAMLEERRIGIRTPEWRALHERIQVAMELTRRLNALAYEDLGGRHTLLDELLGEPLPDKAVIHPPFYCTHGLGTRLGERTSVGQACSFLDLGSVVGAGAVVAKDVPPLTVVTGAGHVVRSNLETLPPPGG